MIKKILSYLLFCLLIINTFSFLVQAAAPTIETTTSINIEEYNATLNGTLSNDGGEVCTVGFQYGTTTAYGTQINYSNYINSPQGFSINVGLNTSLGIQKSQLSGPTESGISKSIPIAAQNMTLQNKYIINASFYMYISGGLGATGNVYFDVWNGTTKNLLQETLLGDASIITVGAWTLYTCNFTNVFLINGDCLIGVRWDTLSNAYIIGIKSSISNPVPNEYMQHYVGTYGSGNWQTFDANDDLVYIINTVNDSLSPGTFYHYRARANNSLGPTYGSDKAFLTKPIEPTGTISTNSSTYHSINLTWTKSSICNTTVIVRSVSSYPVSPWDLSLSGTDTIIYNGTLNYFNDTFTAPPPTGFLYYGLWSYVGNVTLYQYSDACNKSLQFLEWFTVPSVTTNASTLITSDSATLNGYLADDGNDSTQCTFAYGTDIALSSNTSTNYYSKGTEFSASIGSLSHAILYYFKARASNSNSTVNGSIQKLLTIPYPPLAVTVTSKKGTNISIDWNNDTNQTGYNQSTVIRYSITGYPTSLTDGTLAVNLPSPMMSNYTIEGLIPGIKYYFSLWTQLNNSGVFANSSSYSTVSGTTLGGNYNISIYWENLTPVDNFSQLLNTSIYLKKRTGEIINSTIGLTFYNFNMSAADNIDVIYCYFNKSIYPRCITVQPGNNTVKIYVSNRSETAYAMYYNYSSWSGYQLPYIFSFQDLTLLQQYVSAPDTIFFIYLFNGTSVYNVHANYLSADKTVTVSLDYGKTYYCGIFNSQGFIPLLGQLQIGSANSIIIPITSLPNVTYQIEQFIRLSVSNDSTGIWLNLTDSSGGTNTIKITFYNLSNNASTFVFNASIFGTPWSYHWTTGNGAILTNSYKIVVNISHTLFSTNQTMYASFEPSFHIGFVNASNVDTALTSVLGLCPFAPFVTWSMLIGFGLFFICLMAFKGINGEIAVMFGSGIFIFFTSVVFYFSVSQGIAIVGAGFVFILAVISLVDKEKRGGMM